MITAGLSIYSAQRLETLIARLADELAGAPLPPLEREVIVVQSRGMYRWVTLELARRLGIAATLATPFPGTFARALAERIEGKGEHAPSERYEPSGETPFDRDPLTWRIFHLLRSGPKPVTVPAADYIKDDADGRLRFQLASRLAARFDDYQLYRPDMLQAWDRGEQPLDSSAQRDTACWQAAIWRSIREGTGSEKHLARRFTELIDLLRRAERAPSGTPSRVSVFGAASLPPVFLELLGALARVSRVALYVASPTAEFWSDLRSEREAAKQLDLFTGRGLEPVDAHIDVGNSLLVSLGKQGRELETLLQALDVDGSARAPLDTPLPDRATVLGTLQADIVELVERGAGTGRESPLPLPEGDRSLSIHVCHSPMREMQVVRDLLLDAFASDPTLRSNDIFVLAPDIATYAPFIEAVFGVTHEGEPMLRYTIADRGARREEPLLDAAFRLLDLVGSRFAASEVLALLDTAAVRRAAELEASEVETVRTWVTNTPIRWGFDHEQRCAALGLPLGALEPTDAADSWRGGLDRLLLGCAIDGSDDLVAGLLPSTLAASDAELLGRFARFVDRLFAVIDALSRPRPLAAWSKDLLATFTETLAPSDEAEAAALTTLLKVTGGLADLERLSDCNEAVAIETLRDALEAAVVRSGGGAGFIGGAITFCSLQPMRAIPAKIVVVVGLCDGVFPRRDRPASFDLAAATPRLGDRSTKEDDRYLFLETLLAARERLIVSYVGRSQKDNSELAPSSVLAELAAAIDRTFAAAGGMLPSAKLTTDHALQAFSERYFSPSDSGSPASLTSFSFASYSAALASRNATGGEHVFTARPLRLDESPRELTLAELTEFWVNPSKHFCTRTLGLRLPDEESAIADAEPFLLGGIERYQLSEQVLERRLRHRPSGAEELDLLRASARLPHGALARACYDKVREEVDSLVATIDTRFGGLPEPQPPRPIDTHGDGWRVTGVVAHLTDRGQLRYRPALLKPKDHVRAWIAHLALNAQALQETFLVGKKKVPKGDDIYIVKRMAPVADAAIHLDTLVRGYRDGLTTPLPVFENATFEYASRTRNRRLKLTREKRDPYEAAKDKFRSNAHAKGDDADRHVVLCTRGRDIFGEERERFEQLASTLWEPLLAACEEVDE